MLQLSERSSLSEPSSVESGSTSIQLEHESLWRLHEHHATYRMHHETQRAAVSTMVVGFAAAVIGVIASHSGINRNDAVWAGVIIGVGVVGTVISEVEQARYRHHLAYTRACTDLLDALMPGRPIHRARDAKNELKRTNSKRYESRRGLGRFQLHELWTWLNVGVVLIGVALLAIALTR